MRISYKRITVAINSLIVLLVMTFCSAVSAQTIVLVHGYMAGGKVWHISGIVDRLHQLGWRDGGGYGLEADGQIITAINKVNGNAVVTIELPSTEPVLEQSALLGRYLNRIRKDRGDALVLVGHSAGGVVARYHLVKRRPKDVKALITIASPHLGTPMADLGLLANNSPLGQLLLDMGERTLSHSQALLNDLKSAREGSLLYWLNRQPHPSLGYYSIVRTGEATDIREYNKADMVVPMEHQDMNNVVALAGQTWSLASDGGHMLNVDDAVLIEQILLGMK